MPKARWAASSPAGSIAPRRLHVRAPAAVSATRTGCAACCCRIPRGSVNAAVNLVTPPIDPSADIGMIVIEADYYPPMSGSNLMCTVTAVLETGMLPMIEPVTRLCVDTPAGLVQVRSGVRRRQVPAGVVPQRAAFVMHGEKPVDVPGPRHGHGRCRLWRHDLRHRLRRGAGLHPGAGGGARAGGDGRAHQAGRGGAAPVGPSGQSRHPYHQPDPVRRAADSRRMGSRRPRTPWWCRPAESTAARAAQAVRRAWR